MGADTAQPPFDRAAQWACHGCEVRGQVEPAVLHGVAQRQSRLHVPFDAESAGKEFGVAVDLINQGLVDLKPLISATLPYRDAGRAFALAADRTQAMKVLLNFD